MLASVFPGFKSLTTCVVCFEEMPFGTITITGESLTTERDAHCGMGNLVTTIFGSSGLEHGEMWQGSIEI